MIEISCVCTAQTVATSHIWLLSTWNLPSSTEGLTFKFQLILTLHSYMWLIDTILKSTILEFWTFYSQDMFLQDLLSLCSIRIICDCVVRFKNFNVSLLMALPFLTFSRRCFKSASLDICRYFYLLLLFDFLEQQQKINIKHNIQEEPFQA